MSEDSACDDCPTNLQVDELEQRIGKAVKFLDKVFEKEVTAFAYMILKTTLTQSVSPKKSLVDGETKP